MIRYYKANIKVNVNPHLRRLYHNNAQKLKLLFTKLEDLTMYGCIRPDYVEKEELKDKIDNLIDIQLGIRDEAFKKDYKEIYYKLKSPVTNRIKKDYVTPAFLASQSKV